MKILTKDVRIGNMLYCTRDRCTIELLPEDMSGDLSSLEPVLLTDKILDNLGLPTDSDEDYERYIGSLFHLEVEDLNSYDLMIGDRPIKRKIRYVHNLQNICYELGEELTND
jgi:hypothetical protein